MAMQVKTFLTDIYIDERGTSAVEMGLICAMIVLAMLGALQGFAGENMKMWDTVKSKSQESIDRTQ